MKAATKRFKAWARGSARDEAALKALFDQFDADGSGGISLEELQTELASWGELLAAHEVAGLMAEMDADGNGQIDYQEFKGFVLRLTSFDKTERDGALRSAYEALGAVIHESVGAKTRRYDAAGAEEKVLTADTINPCVRKVRYAVRGAVPLLAERLAAELRQGAKKDFDQVLFCNIGNPQSVGQPPITFYREVLALCDHAGLLDHPDVNKLFSAEAVTRARRLKDAMPGGTGAYSHSQGVALLRKDVAEFIEARDGYPSYAEDIFLSNGASSAIELVLNVILGKADDAILVPIPQYPIYTALIELADAKAVGYYLDEDSGWRLEAAELTRSLEEARTRGLNPRALVVINPGNPTGQCLPEETLKEIVRFCKKNQLVLLADEVYQTNVYSETEFASLKKVTRSLGPDYDGFELISFHSTSKGVIGECGRRGGYMELCGIDPDVKAALFKLACIRLCPNLGGQIMTHLMVCPPTAGAQEQFQREFDAIYGALRGNAEIVGQALRELEGVSCQPVEGAMYAFPRITLPPAAVSAAEAEGKAPDMHYCESLLMATGICTVPGSGFGQRSGTFHLRMTFLPAEDRLRAALVRFAEHHRGYLAQYS